LDVTSLGAVSAFFPLPWSHYVQLLAVRNEDARRFYEAEALRGGWSVRQLNRQISSQFYERTLLSKNKAAMLRNGAKPQAEDSVSPEEEIRVCGEFAVGVGVGQGRGMVGSGGQAGFQRNLDKPRAGLAAGRLIGRLRLSGEAWSLAVRRSVGRNRWIRGPVAPQALVSIYWG
jgi:hypothetical protein